MRSNYLDTFLGFTCFGESHGKAVGIVIEDVLPGIEFPISTIQKALNERRPGSSDLVSKRNEKDILQIISGVYEGKTTGMPICLLVYNEDFKSEDYDRIKEVFRPGHADYSWFKKFKIYDWRGGGRASGRETISRVIAGAFLDEMLSPIEIIAYPIAIGIIKSHNINLEFSKNNPLNWPDPDSYEKVIEYMESVRTEGDSLGAVLHCELINVSSGLGDPVFEKLEANLAKAVLSVGGVKGIEFGSGFDLTDKKGSQTNDPFFDYQFQTNNLGGITAGVSTGQNIAFNVALKPISSIAKQQITSNTAGNKEQISVQGRHDICLIPRVIPVIKAMIKITLADAIAHQKLISSSEMDLTDYREAIDKIDEDILLALRRRMEISKKIGIFKKENKLSVENLRREDELINILCEKADILKVNPDLINQIWKLIIHESKKQQ